jgi:hypothetical protein
MNNIHLIFALIILVIFVYIIFCKNVNTTNTTNNIKEHLSAVSAITQNSPVTQSTTILGECPPLKPCYTGDYVFQENGTVKKKDNKFTYESTGNVDFFDYYYSADGSIKRKDGSPGNKFTYKADGTLTTPDLTYLPSRTLQFDNYNFDLSKNLTRKDNTFKYKPDGSFSKGDVSVDTVGKITSNKFVYTPNKDLTFDKYVYNINDKELARPDTKFKYDKNGNIIKDTININSNNEIKTNTFTYVPNQNLTFGEYNYDKDNVLTKGNNFKYSQQNGIEFKDFNYQFASGDLNNTKQNFSYKKDGTIQTKFLTINPTGEMDFNNLVYNNSTGDLKNKDTENPFIYKADGTIQTKDFTYDPNNKNVAFDKFVYNEAINKLTRTDSNFSLDNNGNLTNNNLNITSTGNVNFDNYKFDNTAKELSRKDNTFKYANNGTISKDNIIIQSNNNVDFDGFTYDNATKTLKTKDNKFSYDANGNVIKDNINIKANGQVNFDNYIYSNNNLVNSTNKFSYDSTGKITKDNVIINPDNSLDFGNYIYDAGGKLSNKSNVFEYSNGNLGFGNFVYQENKDLVNNTAQFSYKADGTIKTKGLTIDPVGSLDFNNLTYNNASGILSNKAGNFNYDANSNLKYGAVTVDPSGIITTDNFKYIPNKEMNFDKFVYANDKITRTDNNFNYDTVTGNLTSGNVLVSGTGNITADNLNYSNNTLSFDKYVFDNKKNLTRTDEPSFKYDSSGNITKNNILMNADKSIKFGNFIYDATGKLSNKNNTFQYSNGNLGFDNFVYQENKDLINNTAQFSYKADGTIKTKGLTIDPTGSLDFNNLTYNNSTGTLSNKTGTFNYDANSNLKYGAVTVDPSGIITTDNFKYLPNNQMEFNKFIYANDKITRTDNNFNYDTVTGNLTSGNVLVSGTGNITTDNLNYSNNTLSFDKYVYDNKKNLTRTDEPSFKYDSSGNITKNNISMNADNSINFGNFIYDATGKLSNKTNTFNYTNGNIGFDNFVYQENKDLINNTAQFSYKADGTIKTKGITIDPTGSLDFNNLTYNNATGTLSNKTGTFNYDSNSNLKYGAVTVDPSGVIATNDFKYLPNNQMEFNKFIYANDKISRTDNNFNYDTITGNLTSGNVLVSGTGNITADNLNYSNNTLKFDKYVYDNKKNLTRTDEPTFKYDSSGNISKNNISMNADKSINFGNFTYDATGVLRNKTNTFNYTNGKISFDNFVYQENKDLINSVDNFSYKADGTLQKNTLIVEPTGTLNFNNLTYNNSSGDLISKDATKPFTYKADGTIITDQFTNTPTNLTFNNFTYSNKKLSNNKNIFSYDGSGVIKTEDFNYDSNSKNLTFGNFGYDATGMLKRLDNSFTYKNNILTTNDFVYGSNRDISFNNFNNFVYQESLGRLTNNNITVNKSGLITSPGFNYNSTTRDVSLNNFNNMIYQQSLGKISNSVVSYDKSGIINTQDFTYNTILNDLSFNSIKFNFVNSEMAKIDNTFNYNLKKNGEVKAYKYLINSNYITDLSGNVLKFVNFDANGNAIFNVGDISGFTFNDVTGVKTWKNYPNNVSISPFNEIVDSVEMYDTVRIMKSQYDVNTINGKPWQCYLTTFYDKNNKLLYGNSTLTTKVIYIYHYNSLHGSGGALNDGSMWIDPQFKYMTDPVKLNLNNLSRLPLIFGFIAGYVDIKFTKLTFINKINMGIQTSISTPVRAYDKRSGWNGVRVFLMKNNVIYKEIQLFAINYPGSQFFADYGGIGEITVFNNLTTKIGPIVN